MYSSGEMKFIPFTARVKVMVLTLREMPQLTHLNLGGEGSRLVLLWWLVCWLLVLSAALCGEWAESGWCD